MFDGEASTITDRGIELWLGEGRDPGPGEHRDTERPSVRVDDDASFVTEVEEGSGLAIILNRIHGESGSDPVPEQLLLEEVAQGRAPRSSSVWMSSNSFATPRAVPVLNAESGKRGIPDERRSLVARTRASTSLPAATSSMTA